MRKRLLGWITYSVIFALLPLALSVMVRWIQQSRSEPLDDAAQELLFFALMLNATALGDLNDVIAPRSGPKDFTVALIQVGLLLSAIVSACLYGAMKWIEVNNKAAEMVAWRLFLLSLVLAVASFLLGTVAEFVLGRIEAAAVVKP